MSHNALNQALTSQSLAGSNGSQQPMVTSAQVMQFLGNTVAQGGNNGMMAQNVMQLMQHVPAVISDVSQQLAPVVQQIAPRETQVAKALDSVCVQYQSQIAQLPDTRSSQAAGSELACALQALPAAQTPEGRLLLRQLQQGRVPADNTSQQQLAEMLKQAQKGDVAARLPQLIRQFAKATPAAGEALHKALTSKESHLKEEGKDGVAKESVNAKAAAPLRQEFGQTAELTGHRVERREGQQQGSSGSQQQPQAESEDENDLRIEKSGALQEINTLTAVDSSFVAEGNHNFVPLAAPAGPVGSGHSLAVNLVCPVALSTVDEAQAQRAARHILQNNQVSLSGLVQAPLDGLLLQAATLGLKTFNNTADAVAKSIKINGDAQARLTDKKIADYQEQLAKAREQEHKSKKAKIFSAIFSPVTTVLKAVFKPIMDLIKKIPGVEQAFNFIQKNLSEIALPLAIITSLVCPMSLPMTLGILAVTSAAAGFSIADKVLGNKAPGWLKITDQVGTMVAGMAMMVCTMSMMGGALSNIGGGVMRLFGSTTQQSIKSMMLWGQRLNVVTEAGNSMAQGTLGIQQANLQEQIANLEATYGLDEMQVNWLQHAQKACADNLKNIFSRSAKIADSASHIISETGSLRARIASSLV